jgi:AGZA family xanthine/uracil permease-like MFS transporter
MDILQIDGVTAMPTLPEGLMVNPVTAFSDVIQYGLFGAVLSFFLVTLFDTTGTLVGVGKQAGLLKEDGTIENGHRALFADSLATMGGSLVGTSPSTAYIESAAGVAQGGRTGLTTAVVAGLFGLTLFFSPLIGAISGVAAITAPALIIVGALMLTNVRYIDWSDFSEYFPAFMTILIMPLSGSIERGIAFGFILYPIFKAMNKETVHPLIYLFGALFILEMFFL